MTRARIALAACLTLLGACRRDTQDVRGGEVGDRTLPQRQALPLHTADTTGLPDEGVLARVAIGDLAGVGNNTLDATVASPYANDHAAIKEGNELFVGMNCAGCHSHGGGGMGPPLRDDEWRYGGSMEAIVHTILNGRPNGMPSFKNRITPDQAWQLASYVKSLSARTREDALSGRADEPANVEPPTLDKRKPVRPVTPKQDDASKE
jgi:cytochrome c oxidase cbb3-type subunit 3